MRTNANNFRDTSEVRKEAKDLWEKSLKNMFGVVIARYLKDNTLERVFDVAVNVPFTGTVYSANGKRAYVKIHGETSIKRGWSRRYMEYDLLVEIPQQQGTDYRKGQELTVVPLCITPQGLIFGKED